MRRTATVLTALATLAFAATALRGAPRADAGPEDPPKVPGSAGSPPPGSIPLVAVDQFFHGKVTKVEGTTVELTYDFQDPAQLADFSAAVPFRAIRTVAWEVKNGKVVVQGTGSMRHKAVFDGDCGASATMSPRKARDFGFAVSEERESEVFTLYCCYDRYFGAGDNVTVAQNMIIKFLARDPKANANGMQDWRYCGSRGQNPEITAGKSYKVSMKRTGMESRMAIDDWESKGKEAGRDLTAMQVAVYGYDAHFEVDDLVVHGRLDPQWIARNHIDLTGWKPPVVPGAAKPGEAPSAAETAVSDAAAERTRAKIAGYPLDTKPQALAALLRDTSLAVTLRTEAAEKAKAVGSKKIVPYLVDGLDSKDLEARKLCADVLKGLTGKNFGFRPDGPEDARRKAIRDLNEYLQKNAADFL